MNVNLESYKDLTTKEIVAKMKTGEIAPPPKGEERTKFFEFANAAPGSDVRLGFLTPSEESAPAAPAEGVSTELPPEDPQKETPKDSPPLQKPEEGAKKKEWYEDLGYSSAEEARQKLREREELVQEYKTKYDRFNAERGTLGQENKTLKERLKALEDERKALKKDAPKEQAFDIKRPKRPDVKRPKPSDYEDGELDEKYQQQREKYESAMDAYNESMEAWYDKFVDHNQKIVEKIQSIDELQGKVQRVDTYYQTTAQNARNAANEKAWNDVWDTAKKVTDTYGIEMKVSAREISDAYGVLGNPNASVEQKQLADRFVKTLSESDKAGYATVKQVLETYYDFGSGLPSARMKRLESAIIEAGLDQKLKPKATMSLTAEEEKALREKKMREDQESVSAPSSSAIASGGNPLDQYQTQEEKIARYTELQKKYTQATNSGETYRKAFEAMPEFKEYIKLRRALGIGIPQSFKVYQTT